MEGGEKWRREVEGREIWRRGLSIVVVVKKWKWKRSTDFIIEESVKRKREMKRRKVKRTGLRWFERERAGGGGGGAESRENPDRREILESGRDMGVGEEDEGGGGGEIDRSKVSILFRRIEVADFEEGADLDDFGGDE